MTRFRIEVLAGPAAAEGWIRTSFDGPNAVSKTLRERHDLGAAGEVDVRSVGGAVEVKAGAGNMVEIAYERRAATQQDFDCEVLKVERGQDRLRIWVEHKRERECRLVRADDMLRLTVPRGASVRVRDVGAEVTIRGAQQLEVNDIGDRVEVEVARLGTGGIRISDIGDDVELTLPESVNARLRIDDVGGRVRGPGLRLDSDDEDQYETQLGSGGPLIRIEDVGDSVEIRGPRLARGQPG